MNENNSCIFNLGFDKYKIPVEKETVKNMILNEIAELSKKTGLGGDKLPVEFSDPENETIAFFCYTRNGNGTKPTNLKFNFSLLKMDGFSARQIIDVVRHEFAHYARLIWYGHSENCHDKIWKKICADLGGTPQEYYVPHVTKCVYF